VHSVAGSLFILFKNCRMSCCHWSILCWA